MDAVFLHIAIGNSRVRLNLSDLATLIRASGKPVIVWQIGRRDEVFAIQKEALSLGILLFSELFRAAECLGAVLRERHLPEPIPESGILRQDLPAALTNLLASVARGPLDEHLSKELLRACGIPTVPERIVTGAEQVEAAAVALGYPVVMKGLLPGGVHKAAFTRRRWVSSGWTFRMDRPHCGPLQR